MLGRQPVQNLGRASNGDRPSWEYGETNYLATPENYLLINWLFPGER
ncbi:MAG: hypothetical protein F6J93_36695 [Oscillatoria sp. SIO1A7]|nr:hypothetical protein [Oscillatoria sp. SIO1A7]